MSKPIYCGLAFGSVSIDIAGYLRPCCGISSSTMFINNLNPQTDVIHKINSEPLREVRSELSKGIWHPVCYNCRDAENAGSESMRLVWNKSIPNAPINEYLDQNEVKLLDLSMGNKCNSKCMTCGPSCSDFWTEEFNYINNTNTIYPKYKISNSYVSELLDTFTNITNINIIGGEPLITDEHRALLEKCIDLGISKNITLCYVTNLSVIDEYIIDSWDKFKSICTSVSVDGYGSVNDYIRYPVKFSKIENNIRTYLELFEHKNSYGINLSCTVSIFNIIRVTELLDFYLSLILEYRTKFDIPADRVGVFLNRVNYPNYFNSSILSVEYRKTGLESLYKFKDKLNHIDTPPPTMLDACILLESWINESQTTNPFLVSKAINFIENSDKFRNRKIDDYLPGLLDELKSYEQ